MKQLNLIYLLLAVSVLADAQTPQWQKATDWKLYDISTTRTRQFHPDSLQAYKYIRMDPDTVKYYFTGAAQMPVERTRGIAWMGDFWASCHWQDSLKILRFSRYGGFFEDMTSGFYYEITIALRSSWHLYLINQILEHRALMSPSHE